MAHEPLLVHRARLLILFHGMIVRVEKIEVHFALVKEVGMEAGSTSAASSDDRDYFERLGCVRSSTREQIVAEFRARSLALHPDKTGSHHQ